MIEYAELPDYPGYRFGSDGTIWSRWRRVMTQNGCRVELCEEWRQFKLSPIKDGYHAGYVIVKLKLLGGRLVTRAAHSLILTAFRGTKPQGHESRHLNGVRSDNTIGNLVWGTKDENDSDKRRHGRIKRGMAHPRAKLSDEEVLEIRRLGTSGIDVNAIAARFNMSHGAIYGILSGKNWRLLDVHPEMQS